MDKDRLYRTLEEQRELDALRKEQEAQEGKKFAKAASQSSQQPSRRAPRRK